MAQTPPYGVHRSAAGTYAFGREEYEIKGGHIIYKEDFEATIPVAAGANVVVRVVDGNDRQIDNSEPGRADRQQIIPGVVDKPLAWQMLRIDVVSVAVKK